MNPMQPFFEAKFVAVLRGELAPGVYPFSDALRLPQGVRVVGAGARRTTVKQVAALPEPPPRRKVSVKDIE